MEKEHKDKKEKSGKSSSRSCCYNVVDSCGCIVGVYRCDGPDMTKCHFEKCG